MTSSNIELARYEFKKKLKELRDITGHGTELISLYIPPHRQISDVANYLRNEYSQSSNIKSKSTRKNVMSAIDSILSRLRAYKKPPPNGLVLFVGHKAVGADKTDMVAYVIEPPEPINIFLYRCDSRFFLEPLEDMLKEKKCYGLITIDRNEATIGFLRGKKIDVVKYIESRVPRKHRKGGQSSRRFERLIEEAAHEFFKKVGDLANEAFLAESEMIGVIIGGPGATKEYFAQKDYLHHEIKKKILDLIDTGYTDEYGLRELVEKASTTFKDIELSTEKALMDEFLKELRKKDGGLSVYGLRDIVEALDMGMVSKLLISEDVVIDSCEYVCPECGIKERRFVITSGPSPNIKCPKCRTDMVKEGCKDAIEELVEKAETSGVEVHFISGDTDVGSMLKSAFGGIGGILRFKVRR